MSRRLLARAVAVAALAVLSAGCASGSSGGSSLTPATTSHTLDEHDNGKTVYVHLGDTVVVVLHSTYWTFAVPPIVLQPLGDPVPSPGHCTVAGAGCGTVTSTYNAGHVGATTLHAHRDTCGEAIRCKPAEANWSVTVKVS